jgi:hypothetical protein
MSTGTVADEVTARIAHIEMHRQEMAKEASLAVACGEALRKLHELLEHERAALQRHGTGTAHPANIEAVTIEIERVKKLTGVPHPGLISPNAHPQPEPVPPSNAPRNPARDKGRRTMGRHGEH